MRNLPEFEHVYPYRDFSHASRNGDGDVVVLSPRAIGMDDEFPVKALRGLFYCNRDPFLGSTEPAIIVERTERDGFEKNFGGKFVLFN